MVPASAGTSTSLARRLRNIEPGYLLARDLGGSGLCLLCGGSRLRDEEGAAVVLQLADRLLDVGERPVRQSLLGLRVEHPGEPAAAQLLHRADVDHAVVQVGVELAHVAGEEAAVGGG